MSGPEMITIRTVENPGAGDCLFYSAIQIINKLRESGKVRCLKSELPPLSPSPEGVRQLRELAYKHAQDPNSVCQKMLNNTLSSVPEGKEGLPLDDVRWEFAQTLEEINQMGRWVRSYQAYALVFDAIGFDIEELVGIVAVKDEVPVAGSYTVLIPPSPTGLYLVNIRNAHFAMGTH